VVLVFFRRFGCPLCRHGAQKLSLLKQVLDKNNVRLIGIGLEEDVGNFFGKNMFSGELFIDSSYASHKALQLKRKGIMQGFGVFDRRAWRAFDLAGGLAYNLKGDGLQLGGTFVVGKGACSGVLFPTAVVFCYKARTENIIIFK
jgi:hypothetical protein